MTSRELIKLVEKNGWVLKRIKGSHRQYKKPGESRIITIPHPKKDLPVGTAKIILKILGIK